MLAFALAFLRERLTGAAVALFLALLVTPSSALGFALVFLATPTRRRLAQASIVGLAAVLAYLAVLAVLGVDPRHLTTAVPGARPDRNLVFSLLMLASLVILNLNVLLWPLVIGVRSLWRDRPRLAASLLVAVLPQLVYLGTPERIFVELGSMLLLVFWATCLPVAWAVVGSARIRRAAPWLLTGLVVTYLAVWIVPAHRRGIARREAGVWLREQPLGDVAILGSGEAAVPIALAKYGPGVERLSAFYYDVLHPDLATLRRLGLTSAVLVDARKSWTRELLGSAPLPGFSVARYRIREEVPEGSLRVIYQNPAATLYLWRDVPGFGRRETSPAIEPGRPR